MSSWPLRFVHASDFHLESPPRGVAEVPDHLRELFTEAPYWAAERVFETVLAEEAEFLVLAGDILDLRQAGPRGPLFLCEQFERLAKREIPVYWATAKADSPDAWPAAIALPENVHRFAADRPEQFIYQRNGVPAICLVGMSGGRHTPCAEDFRGHPDGLPTVAVVHGEFDPAALADGDIHYWALGGRHERATQATSPATVHYPGTPQGRSPEEAGTHGCSLVQLDDDGLARTSLVPADVMRWVSGRVVVGPDCDGEALKSRLAERMQSLVDDAPGVDLLVSWAVAAEGSLRNGLRLRGQTGKITEGLRSQFGYGPPAAWSLSIQVELAEGLPEEVYEEDTIRGDFLRAVRDLQHSPTEPLDLVTYLGEPHLRGPFHALARVDEPATRERLLREAAELGAELLGGEEHRP